MESVYRSVYNQQRQKYLGAINKPRMQRVRARHALVFMRDFYFVGHHLDQSLVTSGSIREISTKREKRSLSPRNLIRYTDLGNFSDTHISSSTHSPVKSIRIPRFSISKPTQEPPVNSGSLNSSPDVQHLNSSIQNSPYKISVTKPTQRYSVSIDSSNSPHKNQTLNATSTFYSKPSTHNRNRTIGSMETDTQLPSIHKAQHMSDMLYSSLQNEANLVSSQIAEDKQRHKRSLASLNKQLRNINYQ